MSEAPRPASGEPCARCGATFRCGRNDALPCACNSVELDATTLARLRRDFTGCLCLDCLRSMASAATEPDTPGDPG